MSVPTSNFKFPATVTVEELAPNEIIRSASIRLCIINRSIFSKTLLIKNLTILYFLKEPVEILPLATIMGIVLFFASLTKFGQSSVSVIMNSFGLMASRALPAMHEKSRGK